jgi:hypothetical protein
MKRGTKGDIAYSIARFHVESGDEETGGGDIHKHTPTGNRYIHSQQRERQTGKSSRLVPVS